MLLASSSLAALLIGGGASPAFAACVTQNGGTSLALSNSSAINCIEVFNAAAISGDVTNTGGGVITATGGAAPTRTGITINNASIGGAIVNAGSITASNSGIAAVNATISGGISNSGTITAHTHGVYVNATTFGGGIGNAGMISVGFTAITVKNVSGFSGGITNSSSGTLSVGWTGINVNNVSTFSGNISNAGAISAGTAYGIIANGISTFAGGISNTGTISARLSDIYIENVGTVAGDISNAGTISGGSGVTVHSVAAFAGGIGNTGTITTRTYGIYVNNVSTFTGGISNSGTISSNKFGIVISVISTFSGGVSNTGTISAHTHGISITGVLSFAGGISNAGVLSANQNGINVTNSGTFGSSIAGGISNSGTISGGSHAILISTVSAFSGGISNAGAISAGFTGVGVNNVWTFAGGITSSGVISASNNYGISISNVSVFSGGISSAGTISAQKSGIVISGVSTFAGGISNAGMITARTTHGIYISTVSSFAGGIGNVGTISVGHTAIKIGNVSAFSGGITNSSSGTLAAGWTGININNVSTFSGNISSAGVITGATAYGILVNGISAFAGAVANTGTITARLSDIYVEHIGTLAGGISNAGTISGGAGINVQSISALAGGISNASSGTITARSYGIYVNNVSTFAGNISNAGTITGALAAIRIDSGVTFAPGSAIVNSGITTGTGGTAIDASAATSAVTIDQTAGAINGAIKLSANADVVNISGGAIAGNIVGQGAANTINFNLGGGTFTYGGAYAFTGVNQVNVNSGTVVLNGANSASSIAVNNGGMLTGSGTLNSASVDISGTLAPGNLGVAGTIMNINGNLAFQSGAIYLVTLAGANVSRVDVTGAVSLNGALDVVMQPGNFKGNTHCDILDPTSITGRFSSVNILNLPSSFSAVVTYDTTAVYLDLRASLGAGDRLNVNQQNAASAINGYFNAGGLLPAGFSALFTSVNPGNALSQLSGEPATDASKGAGQLMNDFLNLMLDPTAGGGGEAKGGGAAGFAPAQDPSLPPDVALAYAKALKASRPQDQLSSSFDQRWSSWGSAFGGTSLTEGNAVLGSNNVAASDYGFAAGNDYRATPNVTFGFGLTGGGTNWNLAQALGSGRSDAFGAGIYSKTHWGPLYLSGALAFANHWFTTDRSALGDQLRGKFTGQSYAARLETGYRYAVPIIGAQNTGAIVGVTPYAALQAQDFRTPGYSETDLTGGGFGVSYNAMSATDTRSELGARFDNLQVVSGMPMVLRGRLAWAHDWVSDPSLGAVFQALSGATFIVNGAAPPKDSALTTAAAELHISADWTAMAKFDGVFGMGSQTYGGAGTLKYSW
ncbi:MAG TPA: autotransporter domain-containing protein [Bradyrhizobium sp.]|nr:autotransporter domain-containing protein [Bradyrhizobium sp.]